MKNIWIVNHNATPPSMGGLVRHYYFSKFLSQDNYQVRIITASTVHNSNVNMITGKDKFLEKTVDGVPYTFLRCSDYQGNGFSRIINILEFPIRLWQTYKKFETPDVIYISSPDPFAAFSAILLAKHLKKKCILEIRDLWPESIVCYKGMSRKNYIIVAMFMLEKWLYKHADRLVFTMDGGRDYITERGWDKSHGGPVDLEKVYHINNGVDLEEFDYNKEHFTIEDEDLNDPDTLKVVYTGSIRLANDIKLLVDTAVELQNEEDKRIKILVYGEGNQKSFLMDMVSTLNLKNIIFKGWVEPKFVPYILERCDMAILEGKETAITKYGISPNKLFTYFAAGKPVLSTISSKYDLITKYGVGYVIANATPKNVAQAVRIFFRTNKDDRDRLQLAALKTAELFDYHLLANTAKDIIEDALAGEK